MTDTRWQQVTPEEVPDDYVPVAVPPTPKDALLARLAQPAPPEEEAEASTSAAPMLDLRCAITPQSDGTHRNHTAITPQSHRNHTDHTAITPQDGAITPQSDGYQRSIS